MIVRLAALFVLITSMANTAPTKADWDQVERLAAGHRLGEKFWPIEDILLALAVKAPQPEGIPASLLPEFPPEAQPRFAQEEYYADYGRAIDAERRGDAAFVAAYVRDHRAVAAKIAANYLQTNPEKAPKTELTPFERRFMDGLMLHVGKPESAAFKRYHKLMFEDLPPLAAAPSDGGIRERRIAMWRGYVREQVVLYYERLGTQDGSGEQRLEKEWDLRDRLARQMFTDDRVFGGAPQPARKIAGPADEKPVAGLIPSALLAAGVMVAIGAFLLRRGRTA